MYQTSICFTVSVEQEQKKELYIRGGLKRTHGHAVLCIYASLIHLSRGPSAA